MSTDLFTRIMGIPVLSHFIAQTQPRVNWAHTRPKLIIQFATLLVYDLWTTLKVFIIN